MAGDSTRRGFLRHGGAVLASGACRPSAFSLALTSRHKEPPIPNSSGIASLRVQAASHGLLAGAVLSSTSLQTSDAYRRLAAEQCSIATAETALTWKTLRPTAGNPQFEQADAFVAFCEAHRIKIRGRTLCDRTGLPPWFLQSATAETARALLSDHIRTVAGRYRGRMHSWDVVNEAIDVTHGRADSLSDSLWLRLVGEDVFETAFRTAREADPRRFAHL